MLYRNNKRYIPRVAYDISLVFNVGLFLILALNVGDKLLIKWQYANDIAYRDSILRPVTAIYTPQEPEVVVEYVTPKTIEDKIRAKFGDEADQALKVAYCESTMNPKAKNSQSSARGLFQIMQSWHKINEKWLFNEDINIHVAHQLWTEQGWTPWEASRHCWDQ